MNKIYHNVSKWPLFALLFLRPGQPWLSWQLSIINSWGCRANIGLSHQLSLLSTYLQSIFTCHIIQGGRLIFRPQPLWVDPDGVVTAWSGKLVRTFQPDKETEPRINDTTHWKAGQSAISFPFISLSLHKAWTTWNIKNLQAFRGSTIGLHLA